MNDYTIAHTSSVNSASENSAYDAAIDALDRGYSPVPIPFKLKGPNHNGWQTPEQAVTHENMGGHFSPTVPQNIGLHLGPSALVDIDLDCDEAIKLYSEFLPPTDMMHGRGGVVRHCWYQASGPLEQFRDPLVRENEKNMLVEFRSGDGKQTMIPPSTHPNGERLEWMGNGEPAKIDGGVLLDAARRLAAASLLSRYWPTGSRHAAALALAGGLARAGWAEIDVEKFVLSVAEAAGDDELDDRQRAIADTFKKRAAGEQVTGWPTLAELIDEKVLERVRNWLGIKFGQGAPAVGSRQFQSFSGKELLDKTFLPVKWAVPGLITEGLTFLAGKAKQGKSWLCLDIATAIANGTPALGNVPVTKGRVLYLALEDNARRLQSRLRTMHAQDPDELITFSCGWRRMDHGGLEDLAQWVDAQPEARLIIIDTWKRLSPKRSGGTAYDDDYAALGPLQALAIRSGVAILVVGHTRKAASEDIYDTINGSTGIAACSDSILVLARDRGKADAFLHSTGRDIDTLEQALSWDDRRCRWNLLGDAEQYRESNSRRDIRQCIMPVGEALSPKEIAQRTGKNPGTVRWTIREMVRCGELLLSNDKYLLPTQTDKHTNSKQTNAACLETPIDWQELPVTVCPSAVDQHPQTVTNGPAALEIPHDYAKYQGGETERRLSVGPFVESTNTNDQEAQPYIDWKDMADRGERPKPTHPEIDEGLAIDQVRQFLQEETTPAPEEWIRDRELYRWYKSWVYKLDRQVMPERQLTRIVKSLGWERRHSKESGMTLWMGLRFKGVDDVAA